MLDLESNHELCRKPALIPSLPLRFGSSFGGWVGRVSSPAGSAQACCDGVKSKPALRITTLKAWFIIVGADVRRLKSKSEIRNPKSEIETASFRRLLRSTGFLRRCISRFAVRTVSPRGRKKNHRSNHLRFDRVCRGLLSLEQGPEDLRDHEAEVGSRGARNTPGRPHPHRSGPRPELQRLAVRFGHSR